jgi:hypothetical protein
MANANGDEFPYHKTLSMGPSQPTGTIVRVVARPCYGCGISTTLKYDGIYYCNRCHDPFIWIWEGPSKDSSSPWANQWTDQKKLQYCGYDLDRDFFIKTRDRRCYGCNEPMSWYCSGYIGDDGKAAEDFACWKCNGQEGRGPFWDQPTPADELDLLQTKRKLILSFKDMPQEYLGYHDKDENRPCYFCTKNIVSDKRIDPAEEFSAHSTCLLAASIKFSNLIGPEYALSQNAIPIESQKSCYCCGSKAPRVGACGSFRICLDCYWDNTELSNLDRWTSPYLSNEDLNISMALWLDPVFLAYYTGRPVGEFELNIDLDSLGDMSFSNSCLDPIKVPEDPDEYLKQIRDVMAKMFEIAI